MSVDRDYLETLARQIKTLEKEIQRIKNNQRPTVPVYDTAQWPIDAIEGQVVIAPIV